MCGVLTGELREGVKVRRRSSLVSRDGQAQGVPTTRAACEDTLRVSAHHPLHATTQAPAHQYTGGEYLNHPMGQGVGRKGFFAGGTHWNHESP